MPGGDRTGPNGQGSRTGRKAGFCGRQNAPGSQSRAQGCGCGQGSGQGKGRGLGMAFQHGKQDNKLGGIKKRLLKGDSV